MMPTGDWATGTLVGGVYLFLHSYTFFNLLNMNKCCLPPQSIKNVADVLRNTKSSMMP